MGLSEAVAALVDFDDRLRDEQSERLGMADLAYERDDPQAADHHEKAALRIGLILKPVPLCGPDIHRTRNNIAVPTRRVEARLWSGIITNPGGPWGWSDKVRKRSVYLDSGADSHGVHPADFEVDA